MNDKRKKELEGMFKAILDLKNEYYIGTKEAFEIIKSCQRIYSNPEKVSEIINNNLNYISPLDYPATPERTIGLERVMELCSIKACEDMFEIYNDNNINFIDVHLRQLSKKFELIPIEGNIILNLENDIKKISERFFDVFKTANENKIKSDNLFKITVINYLLDGYSEIKTKIPNEIKDYSDNWMRKFLTSMASLDWDLYFSKEELIRYEKETLSYFESSASLEGMIEKIKRDQLDHRLEYRRMVLCKWLRESNTDNYKEAIDAIENSIRRGRKNLERLKELNAPIPIIKNSEKILDSRKFLIRLIGPEKNFIEKYLRN